MTKADLPPIFCMVLGGIGYALLFSISWKISVGFFLIRCADRLLINKDRIWV